MNKRLKTLTELFEEKERESLEELERQKIVEEQINLDNQLFKKIVSPKIYFNDETKLEEKKVLIEEETESPVVEEEVKLNIEDIVINLSDDIDELKKSIEETKKYKKEIKFLKKYIKNLENELSSEEKFDPTDIYKSIFSIREDIKKVKSEIPEIPEPILYDKQLDELKEIILNVKESIPVVPEIKYYDSELNELLESLESVKSDVENFPEIRYYDYQISLVEDKLLEIKKSIPKIPEIKYYDEDIDYLESKINEVKSCIPDIPEVKYYDEQIISIESGLQNLKGIIDSLPELPEVKYYDSDINKLIENINEIKNTIDDLPKPKYYDDEFKNLDEKIESIKKIIPEPQVIPEIKYYDDEITTLKKDISLLFDRISSIKMSDNKKYNDKLDKFYEEFEQKNTILNEKIKYLEEIFNTINDSQNEVLEESIITEPLDTKNEDPLTPLTQNFVTFKQLQDHYKTFISRIQTQLSTIGGGGETQLKYLDDIVGIATNPVDYDGKYLKYNHSIRKFEFTNVIGQDGDFAGSLRDLFDVDKTNLSDGSIVVYSQSVDKFIFVNPKILGLNSDFNPDPIIDDYGRYN